MEAMHMPDQPYSESQLIRVDNPSAPEIDQIFAIIRAYNDAHIGVWSPKRFAFFVRDAHDNFLGGVYGTIARLALP
jgi:hypothetical protein